MPSQEARERKKLKKEATKLDKEVKTVASSYKAEFAAREKSRMKEQSAARKEVSLLQKALSYKGERKPRVEIPADAAGWKIEQLKEQQKAVNKANKKIELREEAKALGSRYLKVQALRYKTGAKIMEVTAPARQNIGMSNRVIGKKIAAWGMQKVQNKPVLKKDVGAIDISYTAKGFEDSRSPWPFKPTAEMAAEYQKVREYNALKQNDFIENYRKQKKQFFLD